MTYRRDDDWITGTLRDEGVNWTAGPIFFYHTVHNTIGSSLRPTQTNKTTLDHGADKLLSQGGSVKGYTIMAMQGRLPACT